MTAVTHPASVPIARTEPTVAVRRRTIDTVLTAGGALFAIVLFAAGGLLTWGSTFAEEMRVRRAVVAEHRFRPRRRWRGGSDDLVEYADAQVDTGHEAEAYASFIDGDLHGIADGKTYADLGGPERAANAAAKRPWQPRADQRARALEGEAADITGQRNSCSRETLRGLLLSAFAWSTVGRIAGMTAWGLCRRRRDGGPGGPRCSPPPQGGHRRAVARSRRRPRTGGAVPRGCPTVASVGSFACVEHEGVGTEPPSTRSVVTGTSALGRTRTCAHGSGGRCSIR